MNKQTLGEVQDLVGEADGQLSELVYFVTGALRGDMPSTLDPISNEGDAQLRGATCVTKAAFAEAVLAQLLAALTKIKAASSSLHGMYL